MLDSCLRSLRHGWANDLKQPQLKLNNKFDNPEAVLAKLLKEQRYMDSIVRLPFGEGNWSESINRLKRIPGHHETNIEVIIGCLNTPGNSQNMQDYVINRQVIGDMLRKTKLPGVAPIVSGSCRDKVLRLFVLVKKPAK